MEGKVKKNIIIAIFSFVIYFFWPYIIKFLVASLNLSGNILLYVSFSVNFLLLFVFIFIYFKELKEYWQKLRTNFKKSMLKGLKIFILGWLLFLVSNALLGSIFPSVATEDSNYVSMYAIFEKLPVLLLFMSVIYYPIIEEIVFKKTFKGVIKNKWVFVLVTGLLNAAFTAAFSAKSLLGILPVIPNSIMLMAYSYMYYDTDNLLVPIFYRMIYNLFSVVVTILIPVAIIITK